MPQDASIRTRSLLIVCPRLQDVVTIVRALRDVHARLLVAASAAAARAIAEEERVDAIVTPALDLLVDVGAHAPHATRVLVSARGTMMPDVVVVRDVRELAAALHAVLRA